MFLESQETSSCLHFSCCQKLKEAPAFPHVFTADTSSKLKLQFHQYVSKINASIKEISIFQNSFNCATEEIPSNFQLEVINLQHNDMLKEESNCINAFSCDEYA